MGFDKDLSPTAPQPDGARQAMVLGFVWIPLACQVISMVLLRWYRLRREDLAGRAGAAAVPAGTPA
jgi:Na+/melibiose symporter-like transporter